MAKVKISEFSATAANNTDIDGININEGCAPSGINDAIRELMAQLKDFQTGAVGDSFNGPIGTSTAAAGAFTTLSATGAITSTLATGTAPLVIASTTKVANLNVDLLDGADWAAPAALGSTTPAAVSATTLSASSTVTLSGGTANGVAYLNGSKVVTSGSALTFDGSNLTLGGGYMSLNGNGYLRTDISGYLAMQAGSTGFVWRATGNASDWMTLNGTGLGIGTSSPVAPLHVYRASSSSVRIDTDASASTTQLNFAIAGTNKWSLYRPTSSNDLRLFDNATAIDVMTWQVGGNVGIGTSSPDAKLVIANPATGVPTLKLSGFADGTAGIPYAIINFYNEDGSQAGPNNAAAIKALNASSDGSGGQLAFYTALPSASEGSDALERMRLDSSGNLGLGVTPSASSFTTMQIKNASLSGWASDTSAMFLTANASYDGTNFRYISTNWATQYRQQAGQHYWYNAASGTAGNAITFTQAMTLDADGDLGIGTTAPSVRLNLSASNPTNGVLSLIQNISTSGQTGAKIQLDVANVGSSGIGIPDGSSNALSFFVGGMTSASERARIDSSGNLLCGTTSVANSSKVTFGFTPSTQNGLSINDTEATEVSIGYINFSRSGTSKGSITYNNTTGITSYNTTSDYRAKDISGPVTDSGSVIDSIPVYIAKMKGATQERPMFIAHETPSYAHTGEKDAVDADGNPVYQQMDASALIPVMWAEIQSLRKRLADAGI